MFYFRDVLMDASRLRIRDKPTKFSIEIWKCDILLFIFWQKKDPTNTYSSFLLPTYRNFLGGTHGTPPLCLCISMHIEAADIQSRRLRHPPISGSNIKDVVKINLVESRGTRDWFLILIFFFSFCQLYNDVHHRVI